MANATGYVQRCQCPSHQRRHEATINLISKQNEFNEVVVEETDNLRQRIAFKETKVCEVEVALNEKREEITRLENEIREFDEPGVIQMTASDLRQLNAQLAEDLKLLAEKFPNSSPRATPPTPNKNALAGYKRQFSAGSETSWECVDPADIPADLTLDACFSSSAPSTPSTNPSTPATPSSSKSSKVTGFFKKQISKITTPRRANKSSRRCSSEVLKDNGN